MTYKIVTIQNNSFIFFPYTLTIYPYDENVERAIELDDIKNGMNDGDAMQNTMKKLKDAEIENANLIDVNRNFTKPEIRGFQINIAYACNMECRYCFAGDGAHNNSGNLKAELTDKILDFVEANSTGKVVIHIVGGEPLVDFSAFKYLVEKFRIRLGDRVHFTTTINGMLIDENILQFFKEFNIEYMVSLDSCSKEVNDFLRKSKNGISSYEKIICDFKQYKDRFGYDSFHITVTPYNLNFSDTIKYLYDMGAYHISIDFVKSTDQEFIFDKNSVETIRKECRKVEDIILQNIRSKNNISCHPILTRIGRIHQRRPLLNRCGIYSSLFSCDPKGKIYPCDMLMWNQYKIGDIFQGIDTDTVKEMHEQNSKGEMCKKCWARLLCGGMCAADLTLYKDQVNKLCELRKILMETRLRLYIRIRQEGLEFDFDKFL
mgnify:FL=1